MRTNLRSPTVVLVLALAALAGCDRSSGTPGNAVDASANVDSGPGTDASVDSGSGADANVDSGSGTDANVDAGSSSDAGVTSATVAFASATSATWEGTGSFPIDVTLAAASASTVTVGFRASGGTAVGGGVDYTLAAGTLTFAPGETTKTIVVAIVDDMVAEARETLVVALESPSGAALGTASTHTSTLSDDDTRTWPGADAVVTVDGSNVFGGNLSGLVYQPAYASVPASIYAVQNNPAKAFRLVWNGTIWAPSTVSGFGAGKTLTFPTGTGVPDAESVTMIDTTSSLVYVGSERDNANNGTSRNSILLFDLGGATTTVTAMAEWNVTADLPAVGANLGIEAVTFVPDAYLVARGFFDERTGATYDPSNYADHHGGLFFVGLEANGTIYAYALDHTAGTAQRVATIASGHVGIMGLELDREVGYLWAACDNGCNGTQSVLAIEENRLSPLRGRFRVRRFVDRPSTLANLNDEGIAIAPESECVAGQKAFYWTDDGETGGHAVRRDSIPCGDFL